MVPIVFEGGRHDGRRTMWDAPNPPMWIEMPEREPFEVADWDVPSNVFSVPSPTYRLVIWERQGRLDRHGAHVYRERKG